MVDVETYPPGRLWQCLNLVEKQHRGADSGRSGEMAGSFENGFKSYPAYSLARTDCNSQKTAKTSPV